MAININWTDISRTGYEALTQGNFDKAEQLFRSAINHCGFEQEDLRLAYSFLVLGRCLSQKGDYSEAEPMYRKALEIYEKVHGPIHEDVAYSLCGQAKCRLQCGQYESAGNLYKRALGIYETVKGTEHEDTANTLDSLGQCFMAQREYEKAIEVYDRAWKLFSKVRGPYDERVADSLFSLARCHDELNEDRLAAPIFHRALEIYEQQAEPDREQLANCRYNLARCYQGLREFLKAEPLYQKSLEYFQQTRGLERSAAYCTFALATCYMVSGDYRAEEYLKRARALYEKVFGAEHLQTAYLLDAYARLLSNTCRSQESKRLEERAREIRDKFN
ncbi:MAG: tetratricopeptide repeat protein [Candidatus Obscuribacterales bacterium]|jgi:tetratricopeptide (TPR) repeat protein|nr:tetratricopeptide repeat protein [Candidatus Obscuribacterales bacterium]